MAVVAVEFLLVFFSSQHSAVEDQASVGWMLVSVDYLGPLSAMLWLRCLRSAMEKVVM